MNRAQFNNWLKKLGKAWEDKDSQKTVALFADKVTYYETPWEKPYTNKPDIKRLWEDY